MLQTPGERTAQLIRIAHQSKIAADVNSRRGLVRLSAGVNPGRYTPRHSRTPHREQRTRPRNFEWGTPMQTAVTFCYTRSFFSRRKASSANSVWT